MAHRGGEHPYEGGEGRVQDIPLDGGPVDRIRSIEHDKGDAGLTGGLHRVRHGGNVGVVPGSDVLDIEEKSLDALQHLRCGLSGVPVERVDREAGLLVPSALDDVTASDRAPNPVLGGEERHQIQLGGRCQSVDGGNALRVDAGMVRDEADPEPADQVKGIAQKDIDARKHGDLPILPLRRASTGQNAEQDRQKGAGL